MSDNINSMNFKQLKNEVQSLRDELAIMKRKYEDMIYNLDTDNFSQRVVKQGKDMYTKIEQTAEEISLQAEKVDENKQSLAELKITAEEIESEVFEENEDGTKTSRITQTADAIRSEIKSATETLDGKFKNYSTTEQTESKISAKVEEYVTNTLDDKDYVTNAELQITADGIRSTVTSNYNYLSDDIDDVWSYASSINQTANSISTRVGKVEKGQYTQNNVTYTLFTQTDDTFEFNGKYMLMNSAIQLTDNSGNHTFSIFHNEGNGVSDGRRGVYMCGVSLNLATPDPLMIGASNQSVYLYDAVESNLIATQGWVRENAGSGGTGGVATFG